MTTDVQTVLLKRGIPDWPLDHSGLPVSQWTDTQRFNDGRGTPVVRHVTCHSITGSLARFEILMRRKAALLAFDPQI